MTTFYQRRGTGKSSLLVQESHATGLPIATYSDVGVDHLKFLADELKTTIPEPFVASKEACTNAGKYLVDEAGLVLQKVLGGQIVMLTLSDEDDERFDERIRPSIYG